MIKNKNKGILFWITGLSGAGKTSIAKRILKNIDSKYGRSVLLNGDDIRKIFELTDYSYDARKKIGLRYAKLFKKITDQKINVIFAGVVLIEEVRNWNRRNIDNYLEIYIKAELKKIISNKFKKLYFKTKYLQGVEVKAEFPKNPDITIYNNFNKNLNVISVKLFNEIQKII